jgi:hypothetical protein
LSGGDSIADIDIGGYSGIGQSKRVSPAVVWVRFSHNIPKSLEPVDEGYHTCTIDAEQDAEVMLPYW